ncbi:MAG TPA: dihydrolipoamide acetyltransferase family protein [Aggregatilineales bacterium]|nr:dihydrolipoamide acetyltransferase family protein [Aggregatilineales bacterium]
MTDIVLTMDGTLLNWLKEVGDTVKSGEVVAEFEADKATVEVQAPADGVLTAQKAAVGDELTEGTVIATLGAAGEAPAAGKESAPAPAKEEAAKPEEAKAEAPKQAAAPVGNGAAVAATTPDGRVKISPVARNMAEERGIDIRTVQGTGPGGRIVKADIESYQPPAAAPEKAASGAAPAGIPGFTARRLPEGPDVEIIDVTKMRARIAANTVESKQQQPHFYVTSVMNLDPLLLLRKQVNDSLGEDAVKISVNDMVVKAAALALRQFPNLNTHFYGDKLVRYKRINIGIAVAMSNGGLMNVVAKDADKVSIGTLAAQNKEMIARAREGKVKPEDIQGSTFTVSNLGPYDVEHFLAIINPPEAAILAVGSGAKEPVILPDGTLGIGTRIRITISVDHRVSDGAEGAEYLQALKALIENPMRLLV